MKWSSSLVAPSAVAVLSTVFSTASLCSPAASQAGTGSGTLPAVSVEAPRQAARPHRPSEVASSGASRRTSDRTASASGRAAAPAPGSPLARIAALEKVATSCNGGCESSFKSGKDPWVGCSYSGGGYSNGPFSPTCRDTLTYKSYEDCKETKAFLGWDRNRAWWVCSSLQAGGRFQVADLKRPKR